MHHLSTDQLTHCVMGDPAPEEASHLAACRNCAAKVSQLNETLSAFRDSMRHWAHENEGSALTARRVVAGNQNAFGIRRLRWALAFALVLLIGIPVFQSINERHRRADVEDSLLLEQVNAHLSRDVPAPMEPLMELLSRDSTDEIGGHQ